MNIRRAENKDIPTLMALLGQVLQVHHQGRPDIFRPHTTKYSPQELESILSREDTPVFVAEEGSVLGYAFCILKETKDHPLFQDQRSLYIDDLCVDESCRGRGIGKALLNHVRSYAKKLGCDSLTLNVWALNESALNFYTACGLRPQKYGMEEKIS